MEHRDLNLAGIMAFPGAFQKEFDPMVIIKLAHDPDLVASYPSRTSLVDQTQSESVLSLLY